MTTFIAGKGMTEMQLLKTNLQERIQDGVSL
jgi:hypothetical protein